MNRQAALPSDGSQASGATEYAESGVANAILKTRRALPRRGAAVEWDMAEPPLQVWPRAGVLVTPPAQLYHCVQFYTSEVGKSSKKARKQGIFSQLATRQVA